MIDVGADLQRAYDDGYAHGIADAMRWIPRSERLPEHSGRYLVAVLDGRYRRITIAPYHPQSKTWSLTGRIAYWKVIAWMPLPEPPKEDNHETD